MSPRGSAFGRRIAAAFVASAETALAFLVLAACVLPASAQWFEWGQPRRPPPGQFQQLFGPFQSGPEYREPRPQVDYSRAPPPRKAETAPLSNIVVMGDSMADWLAYGLEEAFSDSPEFGIIRKHRTTSGLIRYDSRADYDWARAAREILAAEKPNFVVMMVGLQDRQSIRDRPSAPAAVHPGTAAPGDPQAAPQPQGAAQPGQASPPEQAAAPADNEAEADTPEQPPVAAPERTRTARTTGGTYEFRTDKWAEVYAKRIDETVAALKSKGVPVFWVGLPAVRGTRSTADMIFLNNLFRSRAEKAGIVYVDVWDGFIDERNAFTLSGPDYAGQIRRLRTDDGVHFTKAGARKLAHYVEREIRRAMSRTVPIALPSPQEQQQIQTTTLRPGIPAPRPLAGPVVPLALTAPAPEELVGGGVINTGTPDPIAARVLVKGETLAPQAGRADDFNWPPRQPDTPEPAIASAPAAAPVATPATPSRKALAPASEGAKGSTRAPRSSATGQANGSQTSANSEGGSRSQTKPAPKPTPVPASRSVPRPPAPIGGGQPITGGW